MSPRYYWITSILVIVITLVTGYVTEKRTWKELFIIMCWVILGIFLIVAAVIGFSKLLIFLGIVETGFVL